MFLKGIAKGKQVVTSIMFNKTSLLFLVLGKETIQSMTIEEKGSFTTGTGVSGGTRTFRGGYIDLDTSATVRCTFNFQILPDEFHIFSLTNSASCTHYISVLRNSSGSDWDIFRSTNAQNTN